MSIPNPHSLFVDNRALSKIQKSLLCTWQSWWIKADVPFNFIETFYLPRLSGVTRIHRILSRNRQYLRHGHELSDVT